MLAAAKLAILDAYFPSYLRSHSRLVDAFHYVDGFAGYGSDAEERSAATLHAMAALEQRALPASLTLVEPDPAAHAELAASLSNRLERFVEPLFVNASFASVVPEVLGRPLYRRFQRVATFSLVDVGDDAETLPPSSLRLLLRAPFGECLLFWNQRGMERDAALEPRDRYLQALRDNARVEFLVPLRITTVDAARTTHYLLHCANNALAFKVMKEVIGGTPDRPGDVPEIDFLGDDDVTDISAQLRPQIDVARAAILTELGKGGRPVSLFTDGWVRRATDFLVGREYREILRTLEAEGAIEVVDPKTRRVIPPGERMRAGVPTMAERLLVRLRSKARAD